MARYTYIPNRVIDTNGIADGATIEAYLLDTTTPVSWFADPEMTVPVPNPYTAPAGAEVPPLYYDDTLAVRVRVTTFDGEVISDDNPYVQLADLSDLLEAEETAIDAAERASISAITALEAAEVAQEAADLAQAASTAKIYETWADLSAVAGSAENTAVIYQDGGTHTDPVTGETGVDNAGFYKWSVSPAGWKRIADTLAVTAKYWADEAENTVEQISQQVPQLFDGQAVLNFSMLTNGNPTADTGWCYTSNIIRGVPGDVFKFSYDGLPENFRYITAYNASDVVLPASGAGSPANTWTFPAGVYGIRVTLFMTRLDKYQIERNQITEYFPYGTRKIITAGIGRGAVTKDKLAPASVGVEQTEYLSVGKNKFIKAFATFQGGSILPTTGAIVADTTWTYSDFIKVTPGTAYKASSNFRWYARYNANKIFISSADTSVGQNITPAAGVEYIRLTIPSSTIDTYQFEVGTVSTAYELGGYYLPGYIVAGATSNLTWWNSKVVTAYGDSITNQNRWQPSVAAALGCLIDGAFGVGGRRIAVDSGSMCQQATIDGLPAAPDALIEFGGMNDFLLSTPMGAVGDTTAATFYGALHLMYSRLRTKYPTKQILVMSQVYGEKPSFATQTPPWPNAYTNPLGLTTRDYANAKKIMAERFNLPFVDTMSLAGWASSNLTSFSADLIHPDAGVPAKRIATAAIFGLRMIEPRA